MFNFKDKIYAVLEFVTIDGYFSNIETKNDKVEVRLNFPAIIEMAAVKIKDGKIVEHFSTFVGIDGCGEHGFKFAGDSPEFYGITVEHLIGAPSLYTAIERLFEFTGGCTLITRYSADDSRNPLHIIKKYIEPIYIFNNPVLSINNIITAIKIKDSLSNCTGERNGTDYYKLALELEDRESYADLVAQYLDCDAESYRQDSLSRALLTAKLFLALSNEKPAFEPFDGQAPF